METSCDRCKRRIDGRVKVNRWKDLGIVCTRCLQELESQDACIANAIRVFGRPEAPWSLFGDDKSMGPYSTAQVIALLKAKQVDWRAKAFREGMDEPKSLMLLFRNPEWTGGEIELRDLFGTNCKT